MKQDFSAMILAAGYGKRMMPLTKYKPKPLIEINDITLLENTINFLIELGCFEIIINTHYLHSQIQKFIETKKFKINIRIIYEKDILDTGGGVKNAISNFTHENILVINSDIYWQRNNLLDAESLVNLYFANKNFYLLLSNLENSFGMNRNTGDFIVNSNKVYRFIDGDKILFYSGLQMLNLNHLIEFKHKKFSFNKVWDTMIKNDNLFGKIMNSNWYHVGDIDGLNIARNLDS